VGGLSRYRRRGGKGKLFLPFDTITAGKGSRNFFPFFSRAEKKGIGRREKKGAIFLLILLHEEGGRKNPYASVQGKKGNR